MGRGDTTGAAPTGRRPAAGTAAPAGAATAGAAPTGAVVTGAAPVAQDMVREAAALVAQAAAAGVTLRLIGGVAVRWLLGPSVGRATPPRDIDLVGRRRQTRGIVALMRDAGFEENRVYRLNSGGQVMQFFRPCRHPGEGGAAHADDRVDVYLDALRLEHPLDLTDRLELTQPTVPASDVLLAKLLRTDASCHDLDDALALLRHLPLREDAIDAGYVAARCARSWGLYHDVRRNLERCRRRTAGAEGGAAPEPVTDAAPGPAARAAASLETIDALVRALERQPKSLAWRLRAPFGERLPWSDVVEERDGRHFSSREHVADGPASG